MVRRQYILIGTLAAASLLLESTLTRLLAVSQYYHFAFLVVSLALLGYGASGSILFLLNKKFQLTEQRLNHFLTWLGVGFFLCVGLAYAIINCLPFDSYSITWDRRQILFFGLYYLALTLPFILSGTATGAALSASQGKRHLIYAANLLGSGVGVLVAPFVLQFTGVPGGVLLSALMGLLAILPFYNFKRLIRKEMQYGSLIFLVAGFLSLGYLTWRNLTGISGLGMVISPYKGLTQAMRVPEAKRIFGRWNAVSRVDLLQDAGTHRLPGLSYLYQGAIPDQDGLSIDADTLQPVTLASAKDFQASAFLPEALVFDLFTRPEVLIAEPGGGLGVLQTLSGGKGKVTVIISNPLEAEALNQGLPDWDIYQDKSVVLVFETIRPYLRATEKKFDIVFFPLVDAYRPVASGAFSLSESYNLTVEAYQAAIKVLAPDGVMVISRWLQTPPSESVRVIATLLEAMDDMGYQELGRTLIAYRSIQTMTILLKPSGWDEVALDGIHKFVSTRKFDLVWIPDLKQDEVNQYNKLPEPQYYLLVRDLLTGSNREAVYRSYPFDISPPTDNHPFFYHFFKWGQTKEIIATLGHTWQPFGGSGFLVLFALLALVVLISLVLILMPLMLSKNPRAGIIAFIPFRQYLIVFTYFTFLGFAFLFIEIPLIQKAILIFGHPIYAFTTVVFTILFFSGLGSSAARLSGIPSKLVMTLTPIFAAAVPILLSRIMEMSLGWSMAARILVVVFSLAPLAFLMGFPFPYGLISLEDIGEKIIPWIWAVNGSVSVAASVIAAILNLSFGFRFVLVLGAGFYAGASALYLFVFRNQRRDVNNNPI